MIVMALSVVMLVAVCTAADAASPLESGGGEAAGIVGEKVDRNACYLQCINGSFCPCNLKDVTRRANCCEKYCAKKCGARKECGHFPKKPNCPDL
ncbi:hypothetical protein ABFX02_02G150000 [Erythranthe guttata]